MTDVGHQIDASEAAYLEDVIRRLFRILGACGFGRDEIANATFALLDRLDDVDLERNRLSATADQHIALANVVLRWRRDPEFVGQDGLPATLPFEGEVGSFCRLMRLVAPKEDPGRSLNYMIAVGAVVCDLRQRVTLFAESLLTCTGRDLARVSPIPVLLHLNSFLGSVEHNLTERSGHRSGRFERACYASVPANLVPILERFVESRGQDFIDVVDEWLSRQPKPDDQSPSVTVGAGAYVFVQPEIK